MGQVLTCLYTMLLSYQCTQRHHIIKDSPSEVSQPTVDESKKSTEKGRGAKLIILEL